MLKPKKLSANIARLSLSLLLTAAWGMSLTTSFAQPANDNFADAEIISGGSGSVIGDNFDATGETGEPLHAGISNAPQASVWYRWVAPADGVYSFDTDGSDFDTLLAVYTGDSFTTFLSVAGNDDFDIVNIGPSRVTFFARSGTVYQIAVDGYGVSEFGFPADQGEIVLNWKSGFNAGSFKFTKPVYIASDSEDFPPAWTTTGPRGAGDLGARITVTRTFGSVGRVAVDYMVDTAYYTNVLTTNYFGTNILITNMDSLGVITFTNTFITNVASVNGYQNLVDGNFVDSCDQLFARIDTVRDENGNITLATTNLGPVGLTNLPCIPLQVFNSVTFTTNTAGEVSTMLIETNIFCYVESTNEVVAAAPGFTNNGPVTGTLVFDDYQMSKTFLVKNVGFNYNFNSIANGALVLTLTNATLDPLETGPIALPTFDTNSSLIEVKRFDIGAIPFDGEQNVLPSSQLPCAPQGFIFNFERATFRVSESPGRLFVVTRDGTNNGACSVSYRVNYLHPFQNAEHQFGRFNLLTAGSDFATPVAPYAQYPSAQPADFTGENGPQVTGTLTWGANDFQSKTFEINIVEDDLVEFNEDFLLQLYNPSPAASANPNPDTPGAVIGQIGRAVVTILSGNQPAGAVDVGFNSDNSSGTDPFPNNPNPGANGTVFTTATQPNGLTVIGGTFSAYNGIAINRIARMSLNGLLDQSFNPGGGANNAVTALAIATDGKIWVGGAFTSIDGIDRRSIARLNSNGSLDTTFLPGLGANGTVWSIALQPDGKALISGFFTSVNGTNRNHVARLNPDGSLDTTFDPGVGPDGNVFSLALQPDGKIFIGGDFASVSGTNRNSIARLNADGTLDLTFDPGAGTLDNDANEVGIVYSIALQPDGKIVVGGAFSFAALQSRNSIARFNASGTLDTTFDPGSGAEHTIYSVKLQPDGKILIGGLFSSYNSTRRLGVARLFSHGPLDTSFMDTAYNQFAGLVNPFFTDFTIPSTNNTRNFAFSLSLQSDGGVIVGGGFGHGGGGGGRDGVRPRQNVARLIGGVTPGPGNIQLAYNNYTATENGQRLYVTLARTNGSLGFASATFSPVTLPAGVGTALPGIDFNFNGSRYGNPTWRTTWPGQTWMQMDGLSGQNNATVSVLGNGQTYTPDLDDVFVDILDNTIVDGIKTVNFELARPNGTDLFFLGGENIPLGVALGKSSSTMSIIDNDQPNGVLRFSAPTYVVNESGPAAILNVYRENGSVGPVTVRYNINVTNGTAQLGLDYTTNKQNTLNFAEGDTNKTIVIPIINDTIAEFDETIHVYLTVPTGGATLDTNGANAFVTIIDNDFAPGRLNFLSTTFSTNEGQEFATISVSRSQGSVGSITVQAAASDGIGLKAATNGLDFIGVTNTLSWNAGETSIKTLIVPLLNDGLHEEDELVQLRMFSPTVDGVTNNTALGSISNATLIIVDDDPYGDIQFAAPNFFVNENGGNATITVLRVRGSAEPVSIRYSTRDGSATNGFHYQTNSGVLNFAANEVSKTFPVTIIDNLATNTSRVLNLDLSSPSPSGVLFQTNAATLTIIDNESINEVSGSVDTTLNPAAGVNDFVYSLALQADGKLLFGGDFTAMNQVPRNRIGRLHTNGVLDTVFSSHLPTAGANGSVRSIVSQTDGRIVLGGLFTKVNDVNRGRIARLNSDGSLDTTFNPGAGANNSIYAVAETFVGSSDVAANRRILVAGTFTTVDGQPRNGIARLHNDGSLDGTFTSGLGVSGTNGAIYCMAEQLDGKIIIGGDFTSFNGTNTPHIARLNVNGSLDLTFNPQLGPNNSVRALDIQTDGKIIIGGLFTDVNGTSLNHIARLNPDGSVDNTFTPGVGANDSVFAIALQVDGKIVVGGGFTQASGVTRNRLTRLNANGTVDPTINFGTGADSFVTALAVQPDGKIVLGGGFTEFDGVSRPRLARVYGGSMNGSGKLEFSSANYEVNETGTNAVIIVQRRGSTGSALIGTVFVSAATRDGTATEGFDYVGVTNTLAFPVGEAYATLTIPINNDDLVEDDETVLLALSNSTADDLGNQQNAILTIKNDDAAISFSSSTYNFAENSINGNAIITLVRTGSSLGEASVDFIVTTNGTATVNLDFVLVTNTVFFANGESSKTVAVPLINDSQIEGDETVTMVLSNVIGAILSEPITATLIVVDDDFGPGNLMFSQTNYAVGEGAGTAVVTVVRTNGSQGFVSVNYSAGGAGTASSGLDYTPTNGTLSFGPGELSKSFSVKIAEDGLSEGNETLTLTLSNPGGGAIIAGTNSLPLTIIDNDVSFSFSTPAYVVGEGDSGVTITVRRDNGSNGIVTVYYKTTDGSATNGLDYIGKTNVPPTLANTLTFADGELFKTFTLPILEDSLVEGDETFMVSLFGQTSGAQLANPSNAVVTIVDNDSSLSFSASAITVDEGGTNVLITVARTNTSSGNVSVNFATSNGTALSGSDYSSTNGTLAFLDGESSKTISIRITDDTFVEGDETFTVTLSNPIGSTVLGSPSVLTVTIIDNDAGLRFSSPSFGVSESGVSATITVLRTTVTNTTVSVNYSAVNGTATDGQDFTGQIGTLTFTNGEISKTFTVPIIDDTTIEGDETVLLTLFSTGGQSTIVNPGAAVLTIVDNDGSLIVPAGSALISESINANGVIEASETVSLYFAFRNTVGVNTTDLRATLLSGNGVSSPSGQQSYGVLTVNGPSVSRQFTFTASGTNGQQIAATFQLSDGALNLGTGTFNYTIGQTSIGFTNSALITINDSSSPPTLASPYASTIDVSGVQGNVSKITVTLSNLNHSFPDDIDILLVSPTGQKVVLMSDVGGGSANPITNRTVTFDDSASSFLPDSGLISSGTFRPSDYSSTPADLYPVPAPNGPYASTLSVFNGANPNGTWSLFIVDDTTLNNGSIAKGWSLAISTASSITPTTDLSLTVSDSPDPSAVGNNLTYTLSITNHGPSAATGIVLTNIMADSVTFVSQTCQCTNLNLQTLVCPLPNLARGASHTFNIVVSPNAVGLITNLAVVRGNEADPNLLNNTDSEVTTVDVPRANLGVSLSDSPDPMQINSNLTYTIVVTNIGPAAANNVSLTNALPPGTVLVSAFSSQGTRTTNNGVVIFNWNNLVTGSFHLATVVVRPTVAGIITNIVSTGSTIEDPFKANNTASVKTIVELPSFSLIPTPDGLAIEWGTNAPGYVLESTTDLAEPTVWTPVTNSTVVMNGKNRSIINISTGSRFFRLNPAAP